MPKKARDCPIGFFAGALAMASILLLGMQLLGQGPAMLPSPIQPSPPEKLWALVIGVSNYTHAEPLEYSAPDAEAFADFLMSPRGGGIPESHVLVLTEDKATRTGVLNALESLQGIVQLGDTVHIYIAGHGHLRGNIGYFIPSDGHLSSPAATAVDFAQLKNMVEVGLARARVRVFITDLCHSGRIGAEQSQFAQRIQDLIYQEFLQIQRGTGTYLNLLASRPAEKSWEKDTLGRGIFTYTLLEALNGQGGRPGSMVVDAQDVVSYVISEVPKQTQNQQHPMVNPDFDPALPLAFLDRAGPPDKPFRQRTTLILLNTGRTQFSRVEWTDPATQSTAVRPLSRETDNALITAPGPGEIELRFYDSQNQVKRLHLRLNEGRNTLDILKADLSSYRFRPAGPVQVAALAPLVPQAAAQAASEELEAVLTVKLDRPTNVLVDGTPWGANPNAERQLQLRGLAPGTHTLTLILDANRESRFRVQLFPGSQKFDPQSGELQFIGRDRPALFELAALQNVPPALQITYQRFALAMQEDRLIQPAGDSAWDYFLMIRDAAPPQLRDSMRNRLAIAMGDRAQQTILKYLRGGDIRWNAGVFTEGAILLERTQQLFRQGGVFESQRIFLNARALVERGQYAQAIQDLQRVVALDPQASYAYNAIGLVFWKQNLFDQAIPQLQQAIALTPQWNYPRNTLALIYLEQRRYDDCENAFLTSIQTSPDDSTAYHGLAQLYRLVGRVQDAETQLQRAIEFNPGNAYAYETYGKLYQARRNFPEAENAFRLAMRLEPDEPSFRVSLNELLRETGRIAEAQSGFAQLARAFPADLRVVQSYASFLGQQNRPGEAKSVFERAVKAAPSDANLRIAFGGFMRQQGRAKDARKQLEAALRLVPNNVFARYELAAVFLTQRQTAKAEAELARAIVNDSRLPAPRVLLGQIRFAQRRYADALDEYRRAVGISADPIQQQELKQYIADAETKFAEAEITAANKSSARSDYAGAWSMYRTALARVPTSRVLRAAVLAFIEQHPGQVTQASLPPSLSQVFGSSFWKAQQAAEMLWQRNATEQAIAEFSNALMNLDGRERSIIAGTGFNLGNDAHGIHQLVFRWARRLLDIGRFRAAIALTDAAVGQNIYGVVPNFSPLTLDSLMIPDTGSSPLTFSDYEVFEHPDRRVHGVYAASYAALGEREKVREYLQALEGVPKELEALMLVAEEFRKQQNWDAATALLQDGLSRRSSVDAYVLLAQIQLESGDRAAAKRTFEAARRIFSKDKQLDAARKKLKP